MVNPYNSTSNSHNLTPVDVADSLVDPGDSVEAGENLSLNESLQLRALRMARIAAELEREDALRTAKPQNDEGAEPPTEGSPEVMQNESSFSDDVELPSDDNRDMWRRRELPPREETPAKTSVASSLAKNLAIHRQNTAHERHRMGRV